jgi:hypothetical protein
MSSVEYQPSTIAVASILVARGRETPAGNLDALKAILGSSFPQLDTVSPSCRAAHRVCVSQRVAISSGKGGC